MQVQFHRIDGNGGYAVIIRRDDGLTVRLPGYDRKFRVPHDLAHFVAERELGLAYGVFGCIAAGAMFGTMSIIEGRPRYDARARSRAVLRAHAAELGLAETLSGEVHQAIERGLDFPAAYRRVQNAWGVLRTGPCPYPAATIRRTLDVLVELGNRWRDVRPGQVMPLRWELPVARR